MSSSCSTKRRRQPKHLRLPSPAVSRCSVVVWSEWFCAAGSSLSSWKHHSAPECKVERCLGFSDSTECTSALPAEALVNAVILEATSRHGRQSAVRADGSLLRPITVCSALLLPSLPDIPVVNPGGGDFHGLFLRLSTKAVEWGGEGDVGVMMVSLHIP